MSFLTRTPLKNGVDQNNFRRPSKSFAYDFPVGVPIPKTLISQDDYVNASFEEVAKHHTFGSGQGKHTDPVPAKQNTYKDA